jgi:excisionase family DNA binding protein
MSDNNGILLTAKQVAARLQVSRAWVLDHAAGRCRPVIPSLKLGKSVRFRSEDVDAFLERCRRRMELGLPLQ